VEHFTRYLIHSVPPYAIWPKDKAGPHYFVTQEFEVGRGCFEGFNPAKVSLKANIIDLKTGAVAPHLVWAFSTEGISGAEQIWDMGGLYRIEVPGCCASEDTHKYFSLDTGKLVGSSTTENSLKVEYPSKDGTRYITMESNLSSSPEGKKKALATLFYGDKSAVVQKIAIMKNSDNDDWSVSGLEVAGHDPRQTQISPKPGENLKLHITMVCRCEDKLDMVIPVSASGVDIKHAVITAIKGVQLEEVPLEAKQ